MHAVCCLVAPVVLCCLVLPLQMPPVHFFVGVFAAPLMLSLLFTPLFLLGASGLQFEDGVLHRVAEAGAPGESQPLRQGSQHWLHTSGCPPCAGTAQVGGLSASQRLPLFVSTSCAWSPAPHDELQASHGCLLSLVPALAHSKSQISRFLSSLSSASALGPCLCQRVAVYNVWRLPGVCSLPLHTPPVRTPTLYWPSFYSSSSAEQVWDDFDVLWLLQPLCRTLHACAIGPSSRSFQILPCQPTPPFIQ